jgi:Fe-S-cluster containining protein
MAKFENYKNLLDKIDSQFSKIYENYNSDFQCAKSCHQCCLPKLTVSSVEREYIRQHLLNQPSVVDKLQVLEETDVYEGERCKFLDEKGMCSIYEARPSVCRSHGAPLWFKLPGSDFDDEDYEQDVCFLNFKETDLKTLPPEAFINIDTLNSILAAVNMLFEKEELMPTGKRYELSLEGMGLKNSKLNA